MKTLFLLRHAKSSWADAGQPDFARPLNERGQKSAPLVGRFMRRENLLPDLVLSSPAMRARETITLVAAAGKFSCEVRYDERIYAASLARLLEIVTQLEESTGAVMIVGHNPGMEELVLHLTSEQQHMPTAALACIRLDIEKWSKSRAASGHLEQLIRPKDLVDL